MTDIKINGLPLASEVLDTMQFETDIGGTVANKINMVQMKNTIADSVQMLERIQNTIGSSLDGSGVDISYDDITGITSLVVSKNTIGLGNVDNTSDANKPISNATQAALDNKLNVGVTTASIDDSTNRRYVTDAGLAVLNNTSGVNTGDQTNISGNAGTVTTINGKIAAGYNVDIAGVGTSESPYIISLGVPNNLVNIANHVNVPQDLIYATNFTYVRFNAVKHVAGPANYSNIRIPYVNGRWAVDSEPSASYDLFVKESYVLHKGTLYQAYFSGTPNSGTLSKNYGKTITDVIAGFAPQAGDEFYTLTTVVASDYQSAQIVITNVTNATIGVVTYTGIAPTEGDIRGLVSVGGMVELNYATNGNIVYTVKNLNTTAKTFELWNEAGSAPVNTSGFTPYTSGGVADRQYTHYGTTTGSTMTQDGVIFSTDPTVSITTVARGAKVLQTIDPSKITGGVLASGTSTILKDPANLGQGYGSGLLITAFYGIAGSDALGAVSPGKGLGGFGSPSGGALGSVTVNSGSSKFDVTNLPGFYVGGTGAVNTGWGTATGMFGPVAVLGVPSVKHPTVLLVGDSYNAGGSNWPSGDGSVDEHLLRTQQGATVQRQAVNGNSATQWNTHNTQILAMLNWLKSLGVRYSHIFNAMGVNDFQYNNWVSTVQNSMNTMNNTLLGIFPDAKIIVKKIEPSATSTDSFVTIAGQSAKVVGGNTNAYGLGGYVEQYNANLVSGSPAVAYDYLSSLADIMRDSVATNKFNVDIYKGILPGGISPTPQIMTAVTQANPASVTSAGHGLATGYFIEVTNGSTMTQLTGNRYKVVVTDPNTFTLKTTAGVAIDSSAYTAFSGTGTFLRVGAATSDGIHLNGTASQKCKDVGYGWTL